MNKLRLHFVGENILREMAAPVREINDDVRAQLSAMEKLMREESGIGLAAPQVGISKRMLVFIELDETGERKNVYKIINPKIVSRSEEFIELEEGCLSVQGPNGPVFAPVSRPKSVTVEWTDENGAHMIRDFDGFAARAIQHEMDHLDGILFIDYLSTVKREMVMKKVKKRELLERSLT